MKKVIQKSICKTFYTECAKGPEMDKSGCRLMLIFTLPIAYSQKAIYFRPKTKNKAKGGELS